jgi:hypothetical protein
MVGYMSLEEQVDAEFSRARRRALLRRVSTRLRRDDAPNRLICFDDVRKLSGAVGKVHRGTRTVPVSQIGGSVGRSSEFDGDFMPTKASAEERWKHVDRTFHRGKELPPVSLYKVGGFYFVLDGHHRVSVASYHGVDRRRSDGVWRPGLEGTRTGRRTTQERRTEYVPMAAPPALEGHPRASGARCAAGGSQTTRWPGIGPNVGTEEARRTPPQASEVLMECRLGTGRHHLSAKEGVPSEAAPGLQDNEGCLI